jgi:hypothetical protein
MSQTQSKSSDWAGAGELPSYYWLVQVVAFVLAYSTCMVVAFSDGGIGPLAGFNLFLTVNFLLGTFSGATSPSLERAFILGVVSLVLGTTLTLALLSMPVTLGLIGGYLNDVVLIGVAPLAIFSLITFPVQFLGVGLGSVIHNRLGLPEK